MFLHRTDVDSMGQMEISNIESVSFSKFILPVTFISLVLGLSASAVGIQRSILAIYSQGFSITESTLFAGALTLTLYGTAKAIGNYFGGHFSDKIGRKRTIFVGTFIILLGTLSFLVIEDFAGFIIGNGLLGAGAGLVFAGSTIALTDYSGVAKRSQAVSLMELSVYIGTAIGSFLPSILSMYGSFLLFFQVSFGIAVIGAVVSILGLKESKEIAGLESQTVNITADSILSEVEKVATSHGIQVPPDIQKTFSDVLEKGIQGDGTENGKLKISLFFKPTLIVILMTGAISRLLDTTFLLIYPLFLSKTFTDSTNLFSQLNTTFVLFWAFGIFISPTIVKLAGRRFPLIFGVFAEFALFYVLIQQKSELMVFALVAATGLGLGIYYPLPGAAMADLVPPAVRGRAIGVYRLFLDLGYLLASIFLLLLELVLFPWLFPDLTSVQVFDFMMKIVAAVGIIHAFVLILFLKDSRPVWKQLPYLVNHIRTIKDLGIEITHGIKAFSEGNMERASHHQKLAKDLELRADEILVDLTRKTYSGTFPKRDAFELLKIASRVDKAAGNELRGLRRLLTIDEPLPRNLLNLLLLYSTVEIALLEFLERSIESLKLGLGLAITRAVEVGNVEELLDELYRSMWVELSRTEMQKTIHLIALKDSIELMEKGANQLEDASEIIRLLGYKYYV